MDYEKPDGTLADHSGLPRWIRVGRWLRRFFAELYRSGVFTPLAQVAGWLVVLVVALTASHGSEIPTSTRRPKRTKPLPRGCLRLRSSPRPLSLHRARSTVSRSARAGGSDSGDDRCGR